MNPEQYPNNGYNPYDFILNPSQPPKRSRLPVPGGNNPFIKRLIIIIGGAFLLMIIVAVLLNTFTGSKLDTAQLVAVAQTQQELVRVSLDGTTNAKAQTTKNLAYNTNLSLKTQQQALLQFLVDHGRKVSKKELALKQNATTDQQLTQAKQTSNYDIVFSQLMQKQLQDYATTTKNLFGTSTSDSLRTLLSNDYTQAQLLISQVPSAQSLGSGN